MSALNIPRGLPFKGKGGRRRRQSGGKKKPGWKGHGWGSATIVYDEQRREAKETTPASFKGGRVLKGSKGRGASLNADGYRGEGKLQAARSKR